MPGLMSLASQCCRVWNKGDSLMKLICMAPKANKPDAPMNTGHVVGVNTSNRNDTSTNATRVMKASTSANSQDDGDSNGSVCDAIQTHAAQELSNNGNGDGNGSSSSSPMGSQLNTDVGSLKLTAPGTSRYEASERNSEDDGTADHKAD